MTTQIPEAEEQSVSKPHSVPSPANKESTPATPVALGESDKTPKSPEAVNDSFGKPLKRAPEKNSLAQALTTGLANTGGDMPKTQLVRGAQPLTRADFKQDPVVGWLVVIGGPGLGAFRPIFEGNNTVGRSDSQRIPINFGDDAISGEEQVYIRYDSSERRFLFVPNLAKTNVVSLNDEKPTAAVELEAMDVITVGRTQLVFVPFCGSDFDWSELTDLNA